MKYGLIVLLYRKRMTVTVLPISGGLFMVFAACSNPGGSLKAL